MCAAPCCRFATTASAACAGPLASTAFRRPVGRHEACEPQPLELFWAIEACCVAVFCIEYFGRVLTAHAVVAARCTRSLQVARPQPLPFHTPHLSACACRISARFDASCLVCLLAKACVQEGRSLLRADIAAIPPPPPPSTTADSLTFRRRLYMDCGIWAERSGAQEHY